LSYHPNLVHIYSGGSRLACIEQDVRRS